ncbi:helix-turn-helix domain-containing protein [Actinomadura syzygii]|uniref:Helix-turn-helix domain-containing protein n=1 Tax=Actinomadura syzygii TaxID=1427538 RepID=A0A5D0TSF0_9ACTN|nr:helix-turn-helix domain-containing protein [Actinomadura syzygii]TYC08246.1 helix-turn-helix domain-containing protein [Actinomadura syzygii]
MVNVRVDGWDFGPGQLLSPGEVADMFRVGPATVARWADEGRLSCVRTLGGVRRFSREQIEHFMNNPDSLAPTAPHEEAGGLDGETS